MLKIGRLHYEDGVSVIWVLTKLRFAQWFLQLMQKHSQMMFVIIINLHSQNLKHY